MTNYSKLKFFKSMKKLIYITLCIVGGFINAQVSIGGNQIVNGSSTLLDFAGQTSTSNSGDQETTNFRGIILSAVDNSPVLTSVNNGTFIFDKTTKKVRMYENNIWVDLTDQGSDGNLVTNTSAEVGNGAIIGADTSLATGVLILESANKAIVLPHIKNPHTTVKGPYAGMICYDTVSNSLAVFDGTNWSYWK